MPNKYLNNFQNKRILIIGGTLGIGYAVAEGAIEFGAHVIVASSKQENVDKAVKSLKDSYPDASKRIEGHVCDLGSDEIETNLTKLFDFATSKNSIKLDHLVDTSGATPVPIKIETASPDDIYAYTKSRVIPKIMIGKIAPTYLKEGYTSSITLTSGSLAYKPIKGFGVIGGIVGSDALVRGLALDLAPIRVNLIAPGAINTSLLLNMAGGGDPQPILDRFSKMSILERVGTVEEVAESYLAAMKNTFQTGTTTHSEGGYYLK